MSDDLPKETKERIISQEDMIKMGAVPIIKKGGQQIVFAVSREKKYIKDIERLLWDNRSDIPFGDAYVAHHANPNPGYRGNYILYVLSPSPELISAIVSSPSGVTRYSHLEKYGLRELGDKIHDMYKKGNSIRQLANEFGVNLEDIMIWMHYSEWVLA